MLIQALSADTTTFLNWMPSFGLSWLPDWSSLSVFSRWLIRHEITCFDSRLNYWKRVVVPDFKSASTHPDLIPVDPDLSWTVHEWLLIGALGFWISTGWSIDSPATTGVKLAMLPILLSRSKTQYGVMTRLIQQFEWRLRSVSDQTRHI